jgi:hypothetical protein
MLAIAVLTIASCAPKPEDTMLYLCDGALEIQAASSSVRSFLSAKAADDSTAASRSLQEAKSSLGDAISNLATARAIAPSDCAAWVAGLASAVEALSSATDLASRGGSPAEIDTLLRAADAGRAAMGPASGCEVASPAADAQRRLP